MTELTEKVRRALLPERSRRFLTFGWMTIFVVLGFLWDGALIVLFKPQSVSRNSPPWAPWMNLWFLMHSPVFLVLYNSAVVLGFAAIYLTGKETRYYVGRVVLYGTLIAGIAGEFLYLVQLHFHS